MNGKAGRPGRWMVIRFGLVSAALVGALAALLTTWQTSLIRTAVVAQSQNTAAYSMGLTMNAIGVMPEQKASLSLDQYNEVTGLLRAMVATSEFVGATAWSPPNTVAYAIEPGRVGTHERVRPQLARALAGHLNSIVVSAPEAGAPDATERTALHAAGPLLEIFVPVRLNHRVVSAVVFYQRWRPIQQTIDRQVNEMLMLVLASLLVLWLGLLRFVVVADRRLRTQVAENLALASRDPLTGLPNRKVLRQTVRAALRSSSASGRHTALLLLDLDRFKEVNDTLGHHYGDLLLQQIAPRLRSLLRDGDSVARLGGDEFVVLLTDLDDAATASGVAKRITALLAKPFLLDPTGNPTSVDIEVSIGVALSPQHGISFDQLLQHADIAMYAAKTSGSGYGVYSPASDTTSPEKLAMLGQLRAAIAKPSQLVLYYQPKADLVTGEVLGVEALVRWNHPVDGLLAPSEFIPLAERTGLIHDLTIEVLEQSLAQSRSWTSQGLPLKISVNISTRCLDANLPELISRLLVENQVPAGNLVLEITESAIMVDPIRAIAVLTQLQALGVLLSIDDFGTGYSSLAYVKRFPVHELKIDQSFVTDMTAGGADNAIVKSCIELAHNLGLTVVAEGVETAGVWNQLTELGCDLAQGYYLARPMPSDHMHGWLLERLQRGQRATPVRVVGKRP